MVWLLKYCSAASLCGKSCSKQRSPYSTEHAHRPFLQIADMRLCPNTLCLRPSIPLQHAGRIKLLRICRRTPGFGGTSRWWTWTRSTRCAVLGLVHSGLVCKRFYKLVGLKGGPLGALAEGAGAAGPVPFACGVVYWCGRPGWGLTRSAGVLTIQGLVYQVLPAGAFIY